MGWGWDGMECFPRKITNENVHGLYKYTYIIMKEGREKGRKGNVERDP